MHHGAQLLFKASCTQQPSCWVLGGLGLQAWLAHQLAVRRPHKHL